jgi:hypothetical protein
MFAIRVILETYGLQILDLSSIVYADQRHGHEIQLQRSDSEASTLSAGTTKV